MNKTVFITGATSGIGEACAIRFAEKGYRLILTGRRQERLDLLKEKLGVPTHTLCFDVRDASAVKDAIASLPPEWRDIDILVNNAGLAVGRDPIQSGNIDDWERMIDTNVKGLLYITREVGPMMVARGKGHIFNMGSIAGKEVYPEGNVYCASKHAVNALSQAMRIDMIKNGIKVTHVAPGLVDTEFSLVRFKGDEDKAENVYKGLDPLRGDDIANIIVFIAELPDRVNINDIVVMAGTQASSMIVHREG